MGCLWTKKKLKVDLLSERNEGVSIRNEFVVAMNQQSMSIQMN